jgi:hypothetical protein
VQCNKRINHAENTRNSRPLSRWSLVRRLDSVGAVDQPMMALISAILALLVVILRG